MTPARLRAAGECLYGIRWRSPLSRDLGCSHRTVERWEAGQNPIPDGVEPEIQKLLEARVKKIVDLLADF